MGIVVARWQKAEVSHAESSPRHRQHVVPDPAEFLEYPLDHGFVTGKEFVWASSVEVTEGRLGEAATVDEAAA